MVRSEVKILLKKFLKHNLFIVKIQNKLTFATYERRRGDLVAKGKKAYSVLYVRLNTKEKVYCLERMCSRLGSLRISLQMY